MYLVVILVLGLLAVDLGVGLGGRTVEGRALSRRVDCSSHDCAVSRYGILMFCEDRGGCSK